MKRFWIVMITLIVAGIIYLLWFSNVNFSFSNIGNGIIFLLAKAYLGFCLLKEFLGLIRDVTVRGVKILFYMVILSLII